MKRTPLLAAAAALLLVLAALCVSPRQTPLAQQPLGASTLPDKIGDAEFWQLIETMSEPGGYFRSDNLLSNEDTFQFVIPTLQRRLPSGGVYVGVGPDQNFTYIESLQPKMAFIVDIRRQNMLEHLMYKAILELSADRVDFLSRLFSRQPPVELSPDAPPEDMFRAFEEAAPSGQLFRRNLQTITDRLVKLHGFTLTQDDLNAIEYVYRAFYTSGPDLRYSFPRGFGGGARGFPSYADLMTATDQASVNHSYLANDPNFQILRSYELNNLLVPLTGDFGGEKALRAVGRYVADHDAAVTLFYTSNVEQYLFQSDDQWRNFYANLAALPVQPSSTLLRSYFNMGGGFRAPQGFGFFGSPSRSVMLMDTIPDLLRAVHDGRVRSYYDVIERSR